MGDSEGGSEQDDVSFLRTVFNICSTFSLTANYYNPIINYYKIYMIIIQKLSKSHFFVKKI